MTRQFRALNKMFFRPAVALILIVTVTLSSRAQVTDTPRAIALNQGQILEMKLMKRLNSGRANVGDDVVLKLKKPLLTGGVTILPADWVVHGRVTDVAPAAKPCKQGTIRWELEPLTMKDGTRVEIRAISEEVARYRLLQASQDMDNPKSGATVKQEKGSSVGGTVKGVLVAPLVIVMLPLLVLTFLSEGTDFPCRGKGSEQSIAAGATLYAEISTVKYSGVSQGSRSLDSQSDTTSVSLRSSL